MLSHPPAPMRHPLFGFVQTSVARLQESFQQLQAPSAPPPATAIPLSCGAALQSRFVQHLHPPAAPVRSTVLVGSVDHESSDLVLTGLEDISIQIAVFLDGPTLARVQRVNRAWLEFIKQHREQLFERLLHRSFDPRRVIPSSTTFKSYLLTMRDHLDQELAHNKIISSTHCALEDYCTNHEPVNHGFIAMFCDIVTFPDPQISRVVAAKRQSALSMVLVQTPDNILPFRRHVPNAGPITFVPIDNPHWPEFELPAVTAPGFIGYAVDFARVVHGYAALKSTVVKSILKDLMIFETEQHLEAYRQSIGKEPYAVCLDSPLSNCHRVSFWNTLRDEMRDLKTKERIVRLERRIAAIDRALADMYTR